MARKKMRKFADGGASDEIVVVGGKRPSAMEELSTFNLSRIGGSGGLGGGLGSGMAGMGGGSDSQRLTNLGAAPMPARAAMAIAPAVLRQQASALGNLMGDKGAKGYGAKGSFRFKDGGKAKAKPVKKAKGGSVSSASKRADGCATKGKTKGRFV